MPPTKVGMLLELPAGTVQELLAARKRRAEGDTNSRGKKRRSVAMPSVTTDEEELERCVVHHLAMNDCSVERLLVLKGVADNALLKDKGAADKKTALRGYLREGKSWTFSARDKLYRLDPLSYVEKVFIEEYPGYTAEDRNAVANFALAKCSNLKTRDRAVVRERYVPYADDHLGDPDQIGTRKETNAQQTFMSATASHSVAIASDIELPPATLSSADGLSLAYLRIKFALPDFRGKKTFTMTPTPASGTQYYLPGGAAAKHAVPIVGNLALTAQLEAQLKNHAPKAATSPVKTRAASPPPRASVPVPAAAKPVETASAASKKSKPHEHFNRAFRQQYTKPQLVKFVVASGTHSKSKATALTKKGLLEILEGGANDGNAAAKPSTASSGGVDTAPAPTASVAAAAPPPVDVATMEWDLKMPEYDQAQFSAACRKYEGARGTFVDKQKEAAAHAANCNAALLRVSSISSDSEEAAALQAWYSGNAAPAADILQRQHDLAQKLCAYRQQLDTAARFHACGIKKPSA
eukprot:TRINITY_DN7371_c0_g1_i1.p1 TRINITY_DN7371_c0_g1~~TRINITY_DN7371_c0_g1_i1.p1  ORF type:complete len:540 (+),score=187.63 TRINITY_DN7371_c0_g1_i1:49-1620(+)